jgi:hypothetical protein
MALYVILLVALPAPVMSQEYTVESEQQELQQKVFSQEELAQMLAPIALYPDELISQVLLASTYPLEIVSADRWVEKNKELKGDELAKALEEQDWDPSVKSLVNFPTVLSMMSQKLEITSKLGDAFLAQEADVMATVQMLRKKAVAAGNLKSTGEQKVVVKQEAVIIEPVTPEVVYVPAYDPLLVYGPWFYPAYPPYPYYYYPPPAYGYFAFGGAFTIGVAWGYAWSSCNWHSRTVFVDVHRHRHIHNRFINYNRYASYYDRRRVAGPAGRGAWWHNPTHRRGVAYRDIRTAERFGQSPGRSFRSREARGFGEGRPAGSGEGIGRSPGRAPGEIRRQRGTLPAGQGRITTPVKQLDGKPAGVGRSESSAGGRVVPPGNVRGSSTISTPAPSSRSGSPAVAPRRDIPSGGRFRDGDSVRSYSERGRSSREFSRGGGDTGPGRANPGSFSRPGGSGSPDGGGRSGGGGRSENPGGGRGGGLRR